MNRHNPVASRRRRLPYVAKIKRDDPFRPEDEREIDFQLLSDLRMLAREVAELLDEIVRNFPPGASPAHQHFDVFRPVFFSGFRIDLQRVALAVPRFGRALRVVAEKMPGFMG